MSDAYKIYGAEASPYSVKVRSYFRYKGLKHEWIIRSMNRMAEFQALAKLPLIPLVVTPEGTGLQDSTPIIETIEARHKEPALMPADPALAFLSYLIEEYADEWLNKPMFHYRWSYPADQIWAGRWLARSINPEAPADAHFAAAAAIRERMVPRLGFVGSHAGTRDQIELSYKRLLLHLEAHLKSRLYLLGARPTLGDFGLAGQLYELSRDPTPGALMHSLAPNVLYYLDLMQAPYAGGAFETWETLQPTLLPLLTEEVGGVFFPWTDANARALKAEKTSFTATIEGRPFEQDVQKYHARSLAALKARYAAVKDHALLRDILTRAGCVRYLEAVI